MIIFIRIVSVIAGMGIGFCDEKPLKKVYYLCILILLEIIALGLNQ